MWSVFPCFAATRARLCSTSKSAAWALSGLRFFLFGSGPGLHLRGTPFVLRLNGCLKFAGLQVVDLFPSKTIPGGNLHRLARALRERGASHVCLSSVGLPLGLVVGVGAGALVMFFFG